MPPIRTRHILTPIRKKLRNSMTKPEVFLWLKLKKRGLGGYKFRRQHSIGPYFLDFYCHALYLAVELDGAQHTEPESVLYDQARTEYLNSLKVHVVRFWNGEVLDDIEGVMEELRKVIEWRRGFWPPRPSTGSGHPSLNGRGR